jgi:hypothetical protein
MRSDTVVGYTHSDGYMLCVDHARDNRTKTGLKKDTGNETGYVYPIFASSEWDYYPSCDICHDKIEDVQLTTDGIEYENSHGVKLDWQTWSDVIGSQASEFFLAFANGKNWYCLDCFIEYVLQDKPELIKQFLQDIKNDKIIENEYVYDVFTSIEIQYTSFPQDFMVDGLYCCKCKEELYPPKDDLMESEI